MSSTIRLTMTQALVRFLAAQKTRDDAGILQPIFAGVWAIFGHGNVAGLGEALWAVRDSLPTLRAHNEQAMAHAAIAFAKGTQRRRMMACTSSIGPGALNMVTAAGVAHVNRLPVLFLPGDVFASRTPDPVLQQVEDFGDGTVSANDCFRPVSRYFDRITRPEQIMPALARAMQVLTDPAECGPVTLALCQDVQAEAFDYPETFFAEQVWTLRRARPDLEELAQACALLKGAKNPVIISGGGVLCSQASAALSAFAERFQIPVMETQAGKSSLPFSHAWNMGSVGVTGTSAANALCADADVILAVGTRLQDFTTGSWSLFKNPAKTIIGLNVQPFDAAKHRAAPLVCDARTGLGELALALKDWVAPASWGTHARAAFKDWMVAANKVTAAAPLPLPTDAQVVGAVQRALGSSVAVVCAAGGLPGELHKLWQASDPGSYHVEYGFSCMGYEVAGGLGLKMAHPNRDVVVMIGDGSYLMMNSELATSVMLGHKITLVLLDNRGYGCINRLQHSVGAERFNNLFEHNTLQEVRPAVDFVAHAASLGAHAEKVATIADLEKALVRGQSIDRSCVFVLDTDPMESTAAGGTWWDVAVPEVSESARVRAAREAYDKAIALRGNLN